MPSQPSPRTGLPPTRLLLCGALLLSTLLCGCYVEQGPDPVITTEDDSKRAERTGAELAVQASERYRSEDWFRFNALSWASDAHQRLLVDVHGNRPALATYGSTAEARRGAILVLHSWVSSQKISRGPLWLMIKMERGYDTNHGDWFYAEIAPDGRLTRAGNSANENTRACASCHDRAQETDHLFGLPESARKKDGMYWRRDTYKD